MVRVQVVYGSVYARLAGVPRERLDLPLPTIDSLLQGLTCRHGEAFSGVLVDRQGELLPGAAIFVNGRAASHKTTLREADEVVILFNLEGG